VREFAEMLLRAQGVWEGRDGALRCRAFGGATRGRTLMTMTPTEATAAARQASLIDRGRRVIRLECEALVEVGRRLDERFAQAVDLIAGSTGRVLVAGVGKSGIIGRRSRRRSRPPARRRLSCIRSTACTVILASWVTTTSRF
jgi:hypothetical protein